MSLAEAHRSLARTLPSRLQKFFALNPPQLPAIGSSMSTQSSTSSSIASSAPSASNPPAPKALPSRLNPFLPHKHPASGRWHPPIYSARRQADLVKLAEQYGVVDLLPFTPKKPEERTRRRVEHGLRVKGTGIGQKVKGHEWERTMKGKLAARREAMLQMPMMIAEWKRLGHGRHWKKWPK